jgi:flavodoxin
MKSAIVYASTHHGNTKKLVDAISAEFDVDLVDAVSVAEFDLTPYDLIVFASGIYAAKMHPKVISFAENNLPSGKKIAYIMTSAMNKDFSKCMTSAVSGKDAEVLGVYTCHGYNTFGPFKLVGGTSKGHPDEADVQGAVDFFRRISAE